MQLRISPDVKELYDSWLTRNGFSARVGQKEMMSFINSVITHKDLKYGVVEAPTGIGKTIAYAATAIPLAQIHDRRVIIVTATVALQEQLETDVLPGLSRASAQPFSFAVLKGRQRYVCTKRLKQLIQPDISNLLTRELNKDNSTMSSFHVMLDSLKHDLWDGDLDRRPVALNDGFINRITTDSRGCSNTQCSDYFECPYYNAIIKSRKADVVLTNYDHLLANLKVDNNILPALDKSIVIFDESQHLAAKVQANFSLQCNLISLGETLQETVGSMLRGMRDLSSKTNIDWDLLGRARQNAGFHVKTLTSLVEELDYTQRGADQDLSLHRFVNGRLPNEILEQVKHLEANLESVLAQLSLGFKELLVLQEQSNHESPSTALVEMMESARTVLVELDQGQTLFQGWSDTTSKVPPARWVEKGNNGSSRYVLRSVPIETGSLAEALLWNQIDRAVFTSATIDANDKFNHFLESIGLANSTSVSTRKIDTPFDLAKAVTLQLPRFKSSPTSIKEQEFTVELVSKLPSLLAQERSALVLFTSWKMLDAVVDKLPAATRKNCYIQPREGGTPGFLEEHRQRIDEGEKSYLLGTDALREGVDLPGEYCLHVIVIKLPFEVFTDPVYQSKHEELQTAGKSNQEIFATLQIASTFLKLKQGCGRLIRSDSDRGRITICDNRIQKRYKDMLHALPYRSV